MARANKFSLLGALGLAACQQFWVPGLLPPPTAPSSELAPDPAMCGVGYDAPPQISSGRDIVGAADYHNHQFANLGFGGRVLWGKAFDRDGIDHALSSCGAEDLCVDDREVAVCRLACALASDPERCRAGCASAKCSSSPPHGHFGLTDPIGIALGQGDGHMVGGYPSFQGWPNYNSYTHQQEYYRWLRRAFDGGLKLVVVLAVTNEVLCEALGHEHACDDMTNVDLQLDEAHRLESFIDWQVDCDANNHNGWYRIARTPEEARQIIASGAMAVVLGIEVDTLFNCHKYGTCTAASVKQQVDKYYAKDVRHVFPVHLMDNAFGGTAATNEFFNFGNAVVNHELLAVTDCPKDYSFHFGDPSVKVSEFLHTMASKLGVAYPAYNKNATHCNARKLTQLGADTLTELMRGKMVIDVDHMSAVTRDGALDVAEACQYPGVVSGHSGFTTLNRGQKKSEGQLTDREVDRIVKLGGLLSPILHQGGREEVVAYSGPGTKVANDCGSSSKSFAQAYLYAVDRLREQGLTDFGVGFGSDINGFAGLPAPRFGPYACAGDGIAQTGKVNYPFTPLNGAVASMDRMQAGYRVFDINVDGFAQVGMFPDFVQELRAIGLSDDDLKPLFHSAEAYIKLWEAVDSWNPATPGCPTPKP